MNHQSLTIRIARRWQVTSSDRHVLNTAAIIGVLTLAAKIVGMAKEMMIAAWFGTSDAMDAYLAAFVLPAYANIVIAGSINSVLIPAIVNSREKHGLRESQQLFETTLGLSLLFFTLSTLILAAIAPWVLPLLCSGFSPSKLQLTKELFYLFLPGVFLSGVAMNYEAALNAMERFAVAASAPAAVSIVVVFALLVDRVDPSAHLLAASTVVGFLAQATILAFSLRNHGMSLLPRWHGLGPDLKGVINQYIPTMASSALMCSTVLIDQSIVATLPSGSVSALSYGGRLVSLVLTIATGAVGTTLLPHFSRLVSRSSWGSLRSALMRYVLLILIITIPLTIFMVMLSPVLVALFYQRGNFTAHDTAIVSEIQVMFMLQTPFYIITAVFVRTISSLRISHILVWGALVSALINIVFDFMLVQLMGVRGIALSTSIVYASLSVFFGAILLKTLRKLPD
ncbi:MAG: murein biosynthesis integral membrane protein MurJ [Verrucomicrobiota bacterium]